MLLKKTANKGGTVLSKLYFKFGTMNSSKTANALMTKFNYEERGFNVLLLKPSIDTRDDSNKVSSRIGLESTALEFDTTDDLLDMFYTINNYNFNQHIENFIFNCIIVDEVQFCTKEQIEQLKYITEILDIPVLCYGLKTDFKSELFEGSKRLLEIADSIQEIKSVCHCGKKSIINAKYNGDRIVTSGETIDIGGNEKFTSLCYKCWMRGELGGNHNKHDDHHANKYESDKKPIVKIKLQRTVVI